MKGLYKIISIILTIAVLMPIGANAQSNKEYADTLYELGLFQGTDNGYELEKTLTREEAVTVLVRLLGEEKNLNTDYKEVFSDVAKDRWSFGYVMYCYDNKITNGTGDDTFSPEKPISAEEFTTLILRLLGYTETEPETALQEGIYKSLLNSQIARDLENGTEFLRDDMVYIVYRSLMTKTADGKLLADILADKGVITKSEAGQFDVYGNFEDIDKLIDDLLN